MPLLQFHVMKGRSEQELATLLDAAHRAALEAFHVPLRDRYQIVFEHDPSRVRFEDTGLDIPRTKNFVLVHVFTKKHTTDQKTTFYRKICDEFERSCGIKSTDVMISITSNTDEDWSFGLGRAQFLTGELGGSPATAQAGR